LRREEIFARDGRRCVYCDREFPVEELTVDHVQARVRGGDRSGGNLVTACRGCNTLKGHRRLAEFLAAEPAARANFFRLAQHVWERHLRAVEEEIEGRTKKGD
jgi:5-methylcytosine-specific restriction endonuclease McrA